MNKIRQLLYRTKIAIDSTYHVYWTSLDLSIKGALIAAFVSLLVVYIQKEQQDQKDKDQQTQTEQNKLKYLNFLIVDSYKTLESYKQSVTRIRQNFDVNPFLMPVLINYGPYGLDLIANKINHEEYYLASVSQIKSSEVAELLQLYNALNKNFVEASTHQKTEVPILIKMKDSYFEKLNGLIESVNDYKISASRIRLEGEEKAMYNEIDALLAEINGRLNTVPFQRNRWLVESQRVFNYQLIDILNRRGPITQRKLLLQAKSVANDYNTFVVYMRNVVVVLERSLADQQYMLSRIKLVGQPLFTYIGNLKKENK
ncbi:hypothetical protein [Spirosoma validum]|uniref:Uncharacterized protein n=1 Tax=Spirosoma validum TaxID=2771355 RepID=A0A927B1R5_9BACT|nr:hypothetical protein [Spirosoma validum]MBD2753779.1 hypothetical protein [Spirosoma validum]